MENYIEDQELEQEDVDAGLVSSAVNDDGKPAPANLLESLRQRREEVASDHTVTLSLPGYDQDYPKLYVKYRNVDGKEVDLIARKVQRETKDRWDRQVLSTVDILIEACVGFYVATTSEEEDDPTPLVGPDGTLITGYDHTLSEAFQMNAQSARDTLFELFGGRKNDIMIMSHGVQLSRWMGNTARRVDEDFLGEV